MAPSREQPNGESRRPSVIGGFHAFRLKINSQTSAGAARHFRCLVCNEWRGTAKALDIFGPEHHFYKDEDPEKPVTISCVCDGIPCRKCNKNLIHRPISNQWDEYNVSVRRAPLV